MSSLLFSQMAFRLPLRFRPERMECLCFKAQGFPSTSPIFVNGLFVLAYD